MATQRAAKKSHPKQKPRVGPKKATQRSQTVRRVAPSSPSVTSSPSIPSMARQTTSSSDYEAIRQVLARYCHALDTGALDEVGALFHRNAAFSVSFEREKQYSGREDIQAWYTRFFESRPGDVQHVRHKLFEPVISLNKKTAIAAAYFDVDSVEDGTVQVIVGRYDDILIKENGQWFLKDRTITVFYRYTPGHSQEW